MIRPIGAVTLVSLALLLVLPACAFQSRVVFQQRGEPSSSVPRSSSPASVLAFSSASASSSEQPTTATIETKGEEISALPDHSVILFDGVCNFCNAWVDILLRIDVNGKYKFAPLQSATGRRLLTAVGKQADDISSVVLVQPDLASYYDKSACVLRVVEELGPAAAVASRGARWLVPPALRDGIYDAVAENRYRLLGKRDECRCGDPRYADRFLS